VTLLSVPQDAPAQPAPDKIQLTPLLAGSFCTVAVNGALLVAWTEALAGVTETEMGAGAAVTVIVAADDFELSAMEVAVSVTVPGLGTVAGAV
jgi:hypothetical protein